MTTRPRATTAGKHQGWHRHEEGEPACLCAMGRFWIRVEETADGCWEWLGGHDADGYGVMRAAGGRQVRAHRWSYEQMVGPIPEGLQLDHLCRNPGCTNPDHLEPVDGRTNTLRGFGPSALNARKTECVHGHEFTPENTQVSMDRYGYPRRACRTCNRVKWTEYNRRRPDRQKTTNQKDAS